VTARNFIAIAVGLFVAFFLDYVLEMGASKLFPVASRPTPKTKEELIALFESIPVMTLLFVGFAHSIAIFTGGFISKKINPESSTGIIVIIALFGIRTITEVAQLPLPTWFVIYEISLMTFASVLAFRLFK